MRATRMPRPKGTSTTRSANSRDTVACPGNTPDRPAGRSPRGHRAGQARPGRLRVVEGSRTRAAPEVADGSLGRGLPGLASRMLGDGDALPGPPVRHPHRWHRQRLPPSRGRDRAVDPDRRRRPGPTLGPRRVPADGRQEDAKSAGNFQRVTELVERGLDPLAFRYLTLTSRYGRKLDTGPVDRRGRRGARSLRPRFAPSGPAPVQRPVGGATGPRGRGRRRSTEGSRPGVAGHGGDPGRASRSRDRATECPRRCPSGPRVPRPVRRGDR